MTDNKFILESHLNIRWDCSPTAPPFLPPILVWSLSLCMYVCEIIARHYQAVMRGIHLTSTNKPCDVDTDVIRRAISVISMVCALETLETLMKHFVDTAAGRAAAGINICLGTDNLSIQKHLV